MPKESQQRRRRRYALHHLVRHRYNLNTTTRAIYLRSYDVKRISEGKSLPHWKYVQELIDKFGYNVSQIID